MSNRAVDTLCLLSSVALVSLLSAPAVHAQAAKTFNIPPKSLAAALNDFAAQSQQSILATGDLVSGKISPGANGVSDPQIALARLLEGTGLTYRRSGQAFLIVRAPSAGLPITRIATEQVAAEQTPTASAPPAAATASSGAIEEVVVTATRQSSTVNKVALSVTAVTQKALDQQGVKTISDFARATPSVVFTRSGSEGNPNITIRGISSTLGAPTTGVYLDDTPVQKRGTNGAVTGNGSPTPQIFDLDRIEVLRGPQGTLFGSGSEGGTVRFITPQPSLTKYSAYVRTEASLTNGGSPSYEGGLALGGPLVQDKLGFRASIWNRNIGGYLDHVNIYDGSTIARDTNSGHQLVGRIAVTWQATPDLKITPAFYSGLDHVDDGDTFYQNIPQFSTNGGTFTNKVRIGPPTTGVAPDNNGFYLQFPSATIPSYSFGPYNFFGPYKSGAGLYTTNNCGACTAYTPFGPSQLQMGAITVNGVTYPAQTINIPGQQAGPNIAKAAKSPRTNVLRIPSLDIDYRFHDISAKSITSYAMDDSSGDVQGQFGARASFAPSTTTSASSVGGQFVIPGTTTNVPGGTGGAAGGATYLIMPASPYQFSDFNYYNKASRFVQEFRLSSDTAGKRFTWVTGAYYMTSKQDQFLFQPATEAMTSYALRGIDEAFTLNSLNTGGVNNIPINFTCSATPNAGTSGTTATYNCVEPTAPTYQGNSVIARTVRITESEVAGFGEANYAIITNVKATLGLRVARISNNYTQILEGSVYGDPFPDQGFVATPTHPFAVAGDVQTTSTTGGQTETPVTPHVGLSWQATPDYLLYVSGAEGYRAGGINAPASLANCAAQLAQLGVSQTPLSYTSDKVWSYEGGSKMRLFDGHAQINSSVFYIDWKTPQLTVALTCGSSYVTNAGAAASKGFDVQSQFRFAGITLTPAVAYTDAEYTQDVPVPGSTTFIVRKGMFLPTPKWQATLTAQYDFPLMGKYNGFVRADYNYQSSYIRTNVGQAGYDPITAIGSQTHMANARAGLSRENYEVNLYVNNVANSEELLNVGHTAGSALITGQTFRPREVGLQFSYRY